jgi:hypothetical protein
MGGIVALAGRKPQDKPWNLGAVFDFGEFFVDSPYGTKEEE